MKLDFFLFLFALMLAFLTGNITYSIKAKRQGGLSDLQKIQNLHLEMQEEIAPYKRLDLNIEYPTQEHLKLLTEKTNITKSNNLILDSTECLRTKLNQISSSFINKETLWMGFLCNQIESLPANFFKTPPYISTKGQSFAFMRLKLLRNQLRRIKWLERNAQFMHIQELKSLHWPTSSTQRFLINLPITALNDLIKGENVFYTPDYYFIKNGKLKYFVLENKKVERFFARSGYSYDNTNKGCIFKINSICWKKKQQNIQSFLSESIVVLFIGTIIILSLTANSFFSRLKRKKLDEERKKHALRVLTHELRTPIAALIVHGHNLQNYLEGLPEDVQVEILKIESQIYRLKHLAEKSQGYLQTNDQKLIHLNPVVISSLNDFIYEICVEYTDKEITFNEAPEDMAIKADPYWLKLCVTNLIENAIRYGKAPIVIKIGQEHNQINIDVIDQGLIEFKNIKDLLKTNHTNSKGLGMGMNIVDKTISEMKGKLILMPNPTTFRIQLASYREEEHE